MALADRLNQIIYEQNLTKPEFAEKVGKTENYIYFLTGNSKNRPETISASFAKLIALKFGYDEEWIMYGSDSEAAAAEKHVFDRFICTGPLAAYGITKRQKEFIDLYCEGKTHGEIAAALSVGTSAVNGHRDRVYKRLGVHSRAELIEFMERLNEKQAE